MILNNIFLKKIFFFFKKLFFLKKKILLIILYLFIFRFGSYTYLPGINISLINKLIINNINNNIFNVLNIHSRGSLNKISIFSLGITPYISSSMIIQLLTAIIPSFFNSKNNINLFDKYKINKYTKYFSFFISIIQSIFLTFSISNICIFKQVSIKNCFSFFFISTTSIIIGSILVIWISEQITEFHLCNGISFIIFIGIISDIYKKIIFFIKKINLLSINDIFIIFFSLSVLFFLIFIIIYIECSDRNITINYITKYNLNNDNYTITKSYLPIKINISGVTPTIFSSSLMFFFSNILMLLYNYSNSYKIKKIILLFFPGNLLYVIINNLFIIFFGYIYTFIIFDLNEITNNLKKTGAYIKNIRPGITTKKYLRNILYKLIFIGSIYILFICFIIDYICIFIKIPLYLNSTSLLILINVIIEFIFQFKTEMIIFKYKFLYKIFNI